MKKSIIKNLIALTFALGALVFVAGNVFGQTVFIGPDWTANQLLAPGDKECAGGGNQALPHTHPACNPCNGGGGVGAVSCSISIDGAILGSGGGMSCQVDAGPGFYACCNVLTGCKPCLNPPPPSAN